MRQKTCAAFAINKVENLQFNFFQVINSPGFFVFYLIKLEFMYTEPNCFMPWEIYLDWLADQGHDDLREIGLFSLMSLISIDENFRHHSAIHMPTSNGVGEGANTGSGGTGSEYNGNGPYQILYSNCVERGFGHGSNLAFVHSNYYEFLGCGTGPLL